MDNNRPTTYKTFRAGQGNVDLPQAPEGVSGLVVRVLVFSLGALLVLGSAYAVFRIAPEDLGPKPGAHASVTETVDYWTPKQGDQEALRPVSATVRDSGANLTWVQKLQGPHSPRGGQFALELAEGYELAEDPGADVTFPPTPLWEKPPEIVYLGVPWQTEDGVQLGAFDDFYRLHEVRRDGVTLVKYEAREPNQFFISGDTIWFRSIHRVAFVEPVSGTVVDYRDHETLWRASRDRPTLLQELEPPSQSREKVWEATVEPTPASSQQLLRQAEQHRAEHLEDLLVAGMPLLAAGEVLMWGALVGRPRRWAG